MSEREIKVGTDGRDFRQIEIVVEALKRHHLSSTSGRNNSIHHLPVDTGMILARNIYTFEDAKAKANEVTKARSSLGPGEVQEEGTTPTTAKQGRIDYSKYNPSKRGSFR